MSTYHRSEAAQARRAACFAKLQQVVAAQGYKDIAMLTTAHEAAALVGGMHWVSCKSAKDRTSMLVTHQAALNVQALTPWMT